MNRIEAAAKEQNLPLPALAAAIRPAAVHPAAVLARTFLQNMH